MPVTEQDRQFKAVPGDPAADAVQLYYADFRDDNRQHQFIYRRIKVLSERGKRYGDVVIPIASRYSLTALQARTVKPDGSVVEFTGKPYERLIAGWRDDRLMAKTFTLPGVEIGGIIEYKYELAWEKYLPDAVWTVQHDLYTVKESFSLRPYTGPIHTRYAGDETRLSYVFSNLPAGVHPHDSGSGVELVAENVSAFHPEAFMPAPDNFKAEVRFFYGGREIESPDGFWQDKGKQWYANAQRFMGARNAARAMAAGIMGTERDPEQKLRKLYARVQQVRNLDFERERSSAETRKEALKPNENALEVLSHGFGYRNQIAELFAALASAAGFQVELLRASSRYNHIFDSRLLSENQLQWEIVQVQLNGATLYLDPGTRFCPFGLVAWEHTSTPAFQLSRTGGKFVTVPTATADKAVMRRRAAVRLSPDGSLSGELTLELKGTEALQHRLEALGMDDSGRRTALDAEVQEWLPKGAALRIIDVDGWESSEDPLVAHFEIEVPRFAVVAGKRLLLPANLLQGRALEAFSADQRMYPVYFPFTFEQIDNVSVELPENYLIANLPDGQDEKLASARFITTRSQKNGELILTRALVMNSIYFQPEQYALLKTFFGKFKATDEEQVVINGH